MCPSEKTVAVLFVAAAALMCSGVDAQCAITNVTTHAMTDTTAVISWFVEDECRKTISHFKVYPKHREYLACGDGVGDERLSSVTETSETLVTLNQLQPYSRYEVEIIGLVIGEDGGIIGKTELSTKPGVPDTLPGKSASVPQAFTQALRFYWLPPPKEDCRHQNGELNGYLVELWGLDPWVLQDEPIQSKPLPESIEEIYFHKLKPYTRYKFKVFVQNEGGAYNRNLGQSMTSRTTSLPP